MDKDLLTRHLLFSPDGVEYQAPENVLYFELDKLATEDRSERIRELLVILERPGGYSRLVVAGALLYAVEFDPEWFTRDHLQVLAGQVIQFGERMPVCLEDWRLNRSRSYDVILPYWGIDVENRMITLKEGLPKGWEWVELSVNLDGEDIRRLCIGDDPHAAKDYPTATMTLPDDFPSGQPPWHGFHVLKLELRIRTPAGEITLTDSSELLIGPHGPM